MFSKPARFSAGALAIVGLASLATSLPASAATINDGEAVKICRKKVEQDFGEGVRTKLVRLRSTTDYQLSLKVSGGDKGTFTAKCKVSRDGKLESFEHTAAK
jgi:hypothetical protein